ncbi:MAG: Ig-like domain-containing protein, partial [Selenomonadaceae bacterium]|nr:Ig-like domain-containing protein [Selenomonadaceae bacterium]
MPPTSTHRATGTQPKIEDTSPAMKKKPLLTIRGKSIIIELRDDSLKPNTTYSIEFGSALADNNEGNPLHGMRYVFSTGD